VLLSIGVLDAANEALGDFGVAVERGFDTLGLDAHPANFDLVVHSAQESDVASRAGSGRDRRSCTGSAAPSRPKESRTNFLAVSAGSFK
jgi:hypothetical protein